MFCSQLQYSYLLEVSVLDHHLQHHPGSQAEAVLEQQTFCHILKFPHTVCIPGEQLLLCIRHGSLELFFILADS